MVEDIAKFLYEMGQLKRVKRSGWWVAGIKDPESVAEHCHRTAIIGYVLANMEGADPGKTALICLFHDALEARINDMHKLGRKYSKFDKKLATTEQVSRLPMGISKELLRLLLDGGSPEAKIADDADNLECLVQAREYISQGYGNAQEWVDTSYAALKTKSAKKLAGACMRTEPNEWWQGLYAK